MAVFPNARVCIEWFPFVLTEVAGCSLLHGVYVFVRIAKYLPRYSLVAMQEILNDSTVAGAKYCD